MKTKFKFIDPWTYPITNELSNNCVLTATVEGIIHDPELTKMMLKQQIINKVSLQKHYTRFQRNINYYERGTKIISGHHLHSIKKMSELISKFHVSLHKVRQKDVQITVLMQLCEEVCEYSKKHQQNWENVTYDHHFNAFKQTIKVIVVITCVGLQTEAVDILAKKFFLIQKLNYNNRKKTLKMNQQEQITVLPWSVAEKDWYHAALYVKQQSSIIRAQKLKEHREYFSSKSHPEFPTKNHNQMKEIKKEIEVSNQKQMGDSGVYQDKTCQLWNASKMLTNTSVKFKVQ